jgi:beta-glucosidase
MGKTKKLLLTLAPGFLFCTLSSFTNARAASVVAGKRFYADYDTHEEEMVDAKKLNLEMAAESSILMKNEHGVLPFDNRVKNVSVFGHAAYDYRSGGGGSGSSGTDADATVTNALEKAGLKVNPKLMDFNRNWAENHATISGSGFRRTKTVTEMPTSFLAPVEGSYSLYHDAAIIVISRPGSEFSDNKTYDVPGHSNKLDHILMLEDNEIALIKYIKAQGFDKVVAVINSASPMELDPLINGELKDDIDSVLWIGYTGQNGILALGDVLTGAAEPSGRTVDIYPKDFKKDPTWNNFSDGTQVGATVKDGKVVTSEKTNLRYVNAQGKNEIYKGWNTKVNADGSSQNNGTAYAEVEYEEGIYVGYRYYETRGLVEGGDWYKNNVTFPFGYGLSYTNFSYELVDSTGGAITSVDQQIDVKVKVTNKGSRAGKDVVQLYYSSDYTKGGIEKASTNLGDFAKTKLLKPGESQVLTLSLKARDMADFDYDDANSNGFSGYELEAGTYKLTLNSDSHTVLKGTAGELSVSYTVAEDKTKPATLGKTGLLVEKSAKTGKKIENWFSRDDEFESNKKGLTVADKDAKAGIRYMSRANFAGTFPTAPTQDDLTYTNEALSFFDGQNADYAYEDKATDPWYVAEAGKGWSQLTDAEAKAKPKAKDRGIDLNTMIGKSLDDAGWEKILNNLSYEEMVDYLSGNSRKMNALPGVGKLQEVDNDGPAQLKGGSKGSGVAWVSEVNVASTYNKELAHRQGVMVGNDGLFVGVNGWYGPATDTHRSPLSGRNFEYYSQDGVQGGKIAAEVIKGAQSKGMHVYLKHFALNDQEMNRGTAGGVITYCNEQAMRQIYLKSFELCFTEADCNGTMAAFNRFGKAKSVNYRLYHSILIDEWGFQGVSDSDIGGNVQTMYDFVRCNAYPMGKNSKDGYLLEGKYDKAKNMLYVAKDATEYANKQATLASPTQWSAVRDTVKRSLWTYCNTSGIQNGVRIDEMKGKDDLTGSVGAAVNTSIALDDEVTNHAEEIRYELAGGELPEGVRFDESGKLTGTVLSSGTYAFSVKVTIDGWIEKTLDYKMTVNPAFFLATTTTKAGEDYSAKVTTELVTEDAGYSNINYSIVDGKLPDGLTLSKDGTISGKATTPGTYTFTVNCAAMQGSGRFASRFNYKQEFTITVTGEEAGKSADEKIADLEKEIADLKAQTESGKGSAETEQKIASLEKELADLKGKKTSSSLSAGAIAAIVILGVVAVAGLALGLVGLLGKKSAK